ncbi:MAG: hypothetical protein WD771_11430 [Gemmatimonadaceae bacterium]
MPTDRPVIWAYTYRIEPPQPAAKLRGIKALLDREHVAAKRRAGTWEGRMVADERVSNILVLADTPDLDLEANRRLETALRALDAAYELTVPMVVSDDRPEDVAPKD